MVEIDGGKSDIQPRRQEHRNRLKVLSKSVLAESKLSSGYGYNGWYDQKYPFLSRTFSTDPDMSRSLVDLDDNDDDTDIPQLSSAVAQLLTKASRQAGQTAERLSGMIENVVRCGANVTRSDGGGRGAVGSACSCVATDAAARRVFPLTGGGGEQWWPRRRIPSPEEHNQGVAKIHRKRCGRRRGSGFNGKHRQ